jgi:hypothetical protein
VDAPLEFTTGVEFAGGFVADQHAESTNEKAMMETCVFMLNSISETRRKNQAGRSGIADLGCRIWDLGVGIWDLDFGFETFKSQI